MEAFASANQRATSTPTFPGASIHRQTPRTNQRELPVRFWSAMPFARAVRRRGNRPRRHRSIDTSPYSSHNGFDVVVLSQALPSMLHRPQCVRHTASACLPVENSPALRSGSRSTEVLWSSEKRFRAWRCNSLELSRVQTAFAR